MASEKNNPLSQIEIQKIKSELAQMSRKRRDPLYASKSELADMSNQRKIDKAREQNLFDYNIILRGVEDEIKSALGESLKKQAGEQIKADALGKMSGTLWAGHPAAQGVDRDKVLESKAAAVAMKREEDSKPTFLENTQYVIDKGSLGLSKALNDIIVGIDAGARQIGTTALGVVKALGTNDVVGNIKNAVDQGVSVKQDTIQNHPMAIDSAAQEREFQERWKDKKIGGAAVLVGDVHGVMAGMIPSITARLAVAQLMPHTAAADSVAMIQKIAAGTVMYLKAATASTREALNDGASPAAAEAHGLMSGIINSAGEYIIGHGIEGSVGLIDGLITKYIGIDIMANISNPLVRSFIRYGLSSLGEGAEEVVQGLLETASKRAFYDKTATVDWKELGYEGLIGTLMGATYGIGGLVQDTQVNLSDHKYIKSLAKTADNISTAADANVFVETVNAQIDILADEKFNVEKQVDNNAKESAIGRIDYMTVQLENLAKTIQKNKSKLIERNASTALGKSDAVVFAAGVNALVSEGSADMAADIINKQIDSNDEMISEEKTSPKAKKILETRNVVLKDLLDKIENETYDAESERVRIVDMSLNLSGGELLKTVSVDDGKILVSMAAVGENATEAEKNIAVAKMFENDKEMAKLAKENPETAQSVYNALHKTGNAYSNALTQHVKNVKSSVTATAESVEFAKKAQKALKSYGIKNVVTAELGGENAYYDPIKQTIFINEKLSTEKARFVLAHEVVHFAQKSDPQFTNDFMVDLAEVGVFKYDLVDKYHSAYEAFFKDNGYTEEQIGKILTGSYLVDEIAADRIAFLLEKKNIDLLKELNANKPSLIKRLWSAVKGVFSDGEKEKQYGDIVSTLKTLATESQTVQANAETAPQVQNETETIPQAQNKSDSNNDAESNSDVLVNAQPSADVGAEQAVSAQAQNKAVQGDVVSEGINVPKAKQSATARAGESEAGRKNANVIEHSDFGEKIGGAKKDLWSKRGLYASDVAEMNVLEGEKYVKKDNVWKRPNYLKMVEEKPLSISYFIKNIRDSLPTKPRILRSYDEQTKKAKLEEYVEFIRVVQNSVENIKSEIDASNLIDTVLVNNGYISKNSSSSFYKYVVTDKGRYLVDNKVLSALRLSLKTAEYEARKMQFGVPSELKLPKGYRIFDNNSGITAGSPLKGNYHVTRGSFVIKDGFNTYESALAWLKKETASKKSGKTKFVPSQLEDIHREGRDWRGGENVTGDDYLNDFGFRGGEFGNWLNDRDRTVSMNYAYDALRDLAQALDIAPEDISLNGNLAIAFGARGEGAAVAHYEPVSTVINLTKMKGAGSLAHEWAHALDHYFNYRGGNKTADLLSERGLAKTDDIDLSGVIRAMTYKDAGEAAAIAEHEKQFTRKNKRLFDSINSYFSGEMTSEQQARLDKIKTDIESLTDSDSFNTKGLQESSNIVNELSNLRKEIFSRVIRADDRATLTTVLYDYIRSKNPPKTMSVKTDYYNNSQTFDSLHHKPGKLYWSSKPEMFARAFSTYVMDKLKGGSDYLVGHSEAFVSLVPNKDGVDFDVIQAFPVGEERMAINKEFDKLFADLKKKGIFSPRDSLADSELGNVRYSIDVDDDLNVLYSGEGEQSDVGRFRYSIDIPFEKQVDMALSGQLPSTEAVYVSKTPDILLDIGMSQLPMLITQRHIRDINHAKDKANTRWHGIDADKIKMLPKLLKDPAVIFDSWSKNDSVVVVSEVTDNDNLPIIVSIKPNGKGIYQIETIASNFITSMYGKKNLSHFVDKAIDDDNILYWNKKKSQELFNRIGLHLPQRLNNFDSDTIIRQSDNIVNTIIHENSKKDTETKKFSIDDDYFAQEAKKSMERLGRTYAEIETLKEKLDAKKDVESKLKKALKRVEKLEKELKITEELTPRSSDVRALSKDLAEAFGIKIASQKLSDLISEDLYRPAEAYKAENGDKIPVGWAEKTVEKIAETLLAGYGGEMVEHPDKAEVKQMYRSGGKPIRVYYPPGYKGDIAYTHESYNDFRKRLMGIMTLTSDRSASAVDSWYMEFSEERPELFPEEITHPAEQLEQMARTYREIADPHYENIFLKRPNSFSGELSDIGLKARDDLGEMLVPRIFQLRAEPPTFADRKAAQIKALKEKYADQIAKVRKQRDEKISDMKIKHKEDKADIRAGYADKDIRVRIKRTVDDLAAKLTRPTDRKHIKEHLRTSVAEFLQNVDLSSGRFGTAYQEKLDNLQKSYEAIIQSGDGSFHFDPDLIANIEAAKAFKDISIKDLKGEQLKTLSNLVSAVNSSIHKANRHFNAQRHLTISESAEHVAADSAARKPKQEYAGALGKHFTTVRNFLDYDLADPFSFFKTAGGEMFELYDSIRKGRNTAVTYLKEAADFMSELIKGENIQDWRDSLKSIHKFALADGKVELTTAQIMSLYLTARQHQGMFHIQEGGFRRAPILKSASGKKGLVNKIVRQFSPVKATEAEIERMVSVLTPSQKKIAERMSSFLSKNVAEWGNKTSMELYEYKKFTNPEYFMIITDEMYRNRVISPHVNNATIVNLGATKQRVIGANNPIVIDDIFSLFDRHIGDMAAYGSYVLPLVDFNRIYNYTLENGQKVKGVLERQLSRKGLNFIEQFIIDVNGDRITRDISEAVPNMFIRNYKAAAVGFNMSTVALQPTAYVRALSEIDSKYLVKAALKKGNMKEMLEHSAIAQTKSWGFSEIQNGKSFHQLYDSSGDTAYDKMQNAAMYLAGKADDVTWARIWEALKLETLDNTDLQEGSAEFYKTVADRFDDVIGKTQVVTTVFDTPRVLRSGSTYMRMALAFMAEPLKTLNNIRTDLYAVLQDDNPKTRKKLALTAFVSALNSLVVGMLRSGVQMLRDDEDEKALGAGGTAAKFAINSLKNFGVEAVSFLPWVNDILDMLQGYDPERMDMAGISMLINAVSKMSKSSYSGYAVFRDISSALGYIFGVPVRTVMKDSLSVLRNIAQITDSELLEYELMRLNYKVDGASSAGRTRAYDIMHKAYARGDTESYNAIRYDLMSKGIEPASIDNGIATRLNDELDKLYSLHKEGKRDEYAKMKKDLLNNTGILDSKVISEMTRRKNAELDTAFALWLKDKNGSEYKEYRESLLKYSAIGGTNGFAKEMAKRRRADIKKHARRLVSFPRDSKEFKKEFEEARAKGYTESEIKSAMAEIAPEQEETGQNVG